MHPCLLKKLLPFALTFIVGATIGGLFKSRATTWTSNERTTLMLDRGGSFGYGHSCRMYRRDLVAETKPLVIRFKPDARLPRGYAGGKESLIPARVLVTFGADGKVQAVAPLSDWLIASWQNAAGQDVSPPGNGPTRIPVWDAVERAARQIQFEPETVNSVPVSVSKEIEIRFMPD